MKIVLITNIPSPYRVLQFDKVAEKLGDDFCVFYCAKITSIRKWDIPKLKHNHIFLKRSIIENKWINTDIIRKLRKYNPDIIITSGFFPTSLIAFLYAKIKKTKHIVFTDSWLHSVNKLSFLHRLVRKIVFKYTASFICVGKKGQEYLKKYGAKPDKIFISPLAIDNKYYANFIKKIKDREYDLIFSGQFVERKLPYFVIDVIKKIYEKDYKIKLLLIGSGVLKEDLLNRLDGLSINYTYPGFIQQRELPKFYSKSKILLFPSKNDPWGLVANEACAIGTPVITCKNTGVADDLIINTKTGYVLPLEVETWADKIIELLNNQQLLINLSNNCLIKIKEYSIENAAKGIINAINSVEYEK